MAKKKETTAQANPSRKPLRAFESATTKRSSLFLFETNPRTIDKSARRRLKESVKKFGLVESLVVNRRLSENGFHAEQHGRLVLMGGHQRLSVASELFDYSDETHANDFDVPVAISELTPAEEKALVIALNNPALQGSFDSDLLERLITDPDIDIAATGFDRADLAMMFDQFIVDGIFGETAAEQARQEMPIIDNLEEIRLAGKAAGKVADSLSENQVRFSDNGDSGELATEHTSTTDYAAAPHVHTTGDPIRSQEEILLEERDRKRMERQKYIDKAKFDRDSDFMVTIVAETSAELSAWLGEWGLRLPENRMIALADLNEAIEAR